MSSHPFIAFLAAFIPLVSSKSKQANQALWLVETTGLQDAIDLQESLSQELRLLFHSKETFDQLLLWDQDPSLTDPLLKRQLDVLIRSFKPHLISKDLLMAITKLESALLSSYANFRPLFKGKLISENDIREALKKENDPALRQEAWACSKEIGDILAPSILSLVSLRNQGARSLGYSDFFQMQLSLQEVDSCELFALLSQLEALSEEAYADIIEEIEQRQMQRFAVAKEELGPWAWAEPFSQEDPIAPLDLDILIEKLDICEISSLFYQKMGIDVTPILQASDLFEREKKNQHAFCINVDRGSDIRTLNNIKKTAKWLETLLHELGHAVYEMGFDTNLPWLLREPPHMIPTEAMALIAGRRAYLSELLSTLAPQSKSLIQEAELGLKRRQLIFSRFVLTMTYFEQALYSNPEQDLNSLWWGLVAKYQKIPRPKDRQAKNDWAAKYHIGLAPVYYYSYLLGELFASQIEDTLKKDLGSSSLMNAKAGHFLQDKLFFPGNTMSWSKLVEHVTGQKLTPDAWMRQFT